MDIPKHFYESNYIPTQNEFMEYYISLNPLGDIEMAYSTIRENIKLRGGTPTIENDDNIFSFGYIIEKYNKYLEFWNAKFSDKEEKYIARTDKKKDPFTFLSDHGFNKLYDIEKNNRDNYILTKLNPKTLKRKLLIFNNLINQYENK